jgi:hypothetical protein
LSSLFAIAAENWPNLRLSCRDGRSMEATMQPDYLGPERRRHSLYVTRNTEYHLRDGVCVAVRDRDSGSWLPGHLALSRRLSGAVRATASGTWLPTLEAPAPGEALYFGEGGRELITSALASVGRPPLEAVRCYPLGAGSTG